jgi:hypothetical protein
LAFKGLLKWQEGLQSVVQEERAAAALVSGLEFISQHMKVGVLQVLAVLSIADAASHKFVLSLL